MFLAVEAEREAIQGVVVCLCVCVCACARSAMSDSATPWTVARQAPPSLGFSRQEDWSGLAGQMVERARGGES